MPNGHGFKGSLEFRVSFWSASSVIPMSSESKVAGGQALTHSFLGNGLPTILIGNDMIQERPGTRINGLSQHTLPAIPDGAQDGYFMRLLDA